MPTVKKTSKAGPGPKKPLKYYSEIDAGKGKYSKPRTEKQQKEWEKGEEAMINYKGRPPMKGGGKIKKAFLGGLFGGGNRNRNINKNKVKVKIKIKGKNRNMGNNSGMSGQPPISGLNTSQLGQSFGSLLEGAKKGTKVSKTKAKSGTKMGKCKYGCK